LQLAKQEDKKGHRQQLQCGCKSIQHATPWSQIQVPNSQLTATKQNNTFGVEVEVGVTGQVPNRNEEK